MPVKRSPSTGRQVPREMGCAHLDFELSKIDSGLNRFGVFRPNKKRPKRSHGVAESCTLCVHKLDTGGEPACVEACQAKGCDAITVGNLNDPEDPVSVAIAFGGATRLREDLGTEPKVYYRGL